MKTKLNEHEKLTINQSRLKTKLFAVYVSANTAVPIHRHQKGPHATWLGDLTYAQGPHDKYEKLFLVFMHESSYCYQRILAITILSVRPSHGWISQKRCKIRSPNLHRRLLGRL